MLLVTACAISFAVFAAQNQPRSRRNVIIFVAAALSIFGVVAVLEDQLGPIDPTSPGGERTSSTTQIAPSM